MKKRLIFILIFCILFFGYSRLKEHFASAATATIPLNGRIFWTGTNGNIPAGWSRDTNFDGRYLQGADAAYTAPANGGSATHTHTLSAHSHLEHSHTHTLTSNSGSSGVGALVRSGSVDSLPPSGGHSHDFGTSYPTATDNFGTATTVLNAADNGPSAVKLIVIKPNSANKKIPDDAIIFFSKTTAPSGFSKTDGNNSTTNLNLQYVVGADAGGDAGGSFGSFNHSHTSVAHTHTASAHNHGSATSSKQNGATLNTRNGTGVNARSWGHHSVASNSTTSPDLNTASPTTDTVVNKPATVRFAAMQNTSGSVQDVPENTIIAFVGSYASVPRSDGWYVCDKKDHPNTPDAENRQVQIVFSVVGTHIGSDTHSHSISHQHTQSAAHTHPVGTVTWTGAQAKPFGFPYASVEATNHTHTWTISSTTPTDPDSVTETTSTEDLRAPYRTVLWVKYIGAPTINLKGGKILGKVTLTFLQIGMVFCGIIILPFGKIK